MSTAQELARLRRLRSTIERAQARIKELSDARDEIIADLLIERTATGDVVGAAAGVSQPRTVQIKNSDGVCWEAAYSAPASNRTDRFSDKSD